MKYKIILFSILSLFCSYVMGAEVFKMVTFEDTAWKVCLEAPMLYKKGDLCRNVFSTRVYNEQLIWDYILRKFYNLERRGDTIYTK